jgi:hypothetical protein
MSVHYIHSKNKKVILAKDSLDGLVDALADMMLLHGTPDIDDAIEAAIGLAQSHYDAEKGGESEGYQIVVDPQDNTFRLIPLMDWIKGAR